MQQANGARTDCPENFCVRRGRRLEAPGPLNFQGTDSTLKSSRTQLTRRRVSGPCLPSHAAAAAAGECNLEAGRTGERPPIRARIAHACFTTAAALGGRRVARPRTRLRAGPGGGRGRAGGAQRERESTEAKPHIRPPSLESSVGPRGIGAVERASERAGD